MIRLCKWCGEEFETDHPRKLFCCRDCKNKHQNELYHSRRVGLAPPAVLRTKNKKVNEEIVRIDLEAKKIGLRYADIQKMETLELIRSGKL